MNSIDRAIINALNVNLAYRDKETVGVVLQEWAQILGDGAKEKIQASRELCERMVSVFRTLGVNAALLSYVPAEARNGADAVPELYESAKGLDVLFMPTVFSLTHTPFRKAMTAHGTRIASMPGFTLEMFESGGPMDIDYGELAKETQKIRGKLAASRFVRVTASGTDMRIEIVPETAHASTGMLDKPGAEAYALLREGLPVILPSRRGGAARFRCLFQ